MKRPVLFGTFKRSKQLEIHSRKGRQCCTGRKSQCTDIVEGTEIYPKDIKKNSNYASTNSADYYFTWWGGNLRGVKDYPVNLGKNQDQLVYSPHDYGPSVFEQPWFKGNYTYDSLYKDCWKDNWMYIHEKNIAPLLIGEWGGFMKEPNLTWMTYLRKLIKTNKLNHTFWCFNSNSGDTGGLVLGDFVTWDEEKYKFVKEVCGKKAENLSAWIQNTPWEKWNFPDDFKNNRYKSWVQCSRDLHLK
jgi:hypothetical protein